MNTKKTSKSRQHCRTTMFYIPHIYYGLACFGLAHMFRAIKTKAYDRFVSKNMVLACDASKLSGTVVLNVGECLCLCSDMHGYLSMCVSVVLATFNHVVCIRDSRVVLVIHHLRDGCNRRIEQRNPTLL